MKVNLQKWFNTLLHKKTETPIIPYNMVFVKSESINNTFFFFFESLLMCIIINICTLQSKDLELKLCLYDKNLNKIFSTAFLAFKRRIISRMNG